MIGGPKTMADQLRHLAVMTERAPVEVRVIPWGAGGHAALSGAFELLDFADARPLVYLEQLGSGLLLDQGVDVAPCVRAVATLDSFALTPAKSL